MSLALLTTLFCFFFKQFKLPKTNKGEGINQLYWCTFVFFVRWSKQRISDLVGWLLIWKDKRHEATDISIYYSVLLCWSNTVRVFGINTTVYLPSVTAGSPIQLYPVSHTHAHTHTNLLLCMETTHPVSFDQTSSHSGRDSFYNGECVLSR